jgi:hypothetical protein
VSANEVLWSIISGLALWYMWIWKNRNARVFGNNNHIPADCSKSVSANEVLWSIISGLALWYIGIWKSRNARVFGNNNHIPADCIVSVIRGLAVDSWKNKSEDMCRGAFRSRSTKWGGNSLLKMG